MLAADILKRFDLNGPRYTSYPTADRFHAQFDDRAYEQALQQPLTDSASLYLHIPFCQSLCYYCACNKIVTKRRSDAEPYLRALLREIELVAAKTGRVAVTQVALGGGTPNFLGLDQQTQIMQALSQAFELQDVREQAIELDPRFLSADYVQALAGMGYNRVSFGVQDFDLEVQTLIHRFQSPQQTRDAVSWARAAGIPSVSIDLVYGLPIQDRDRFAATLEQVVHILPDRIALFNYAHIPTRFKPQRRIPTESLPSVEARTALFHYATERLLDAGYVQIGLDHFARPQDSLARALHDGSLRRNFQGYSTCRGADVIGLGVSAISSYGGSYAQNAHQIDAYYERILGGRLATVRGIALTRDDQIRRSVIEALMTLGRVQWAALDAQYGGDSKAAFGPERARLAVLAQSGVVSLDEKGFALTDAGRLLMRAVAMVFDRYLADAPGSGVSYSRLA